MIQPLKLALIKQEKEDYGQTLGKWGVGEGCYIVLPILGPSTLRDALPLCKFSGGNAWYNITVREDTHYCLILIIMLQEE